MTLPAMATRLQLFGRPHVEHEGAVDPLPAERRFQLIALLALRRGWVARSELASLLWPEHETGLAQANVRKALHFARALPWATTLEAEGNAVRFQIATDVDEFEAATREGRVDDALRLRRGELLDGFADRASPAWTEWLESERARLARRWQALVRVRLASLQGAPNERAALARELLDADPLDEEALIALLGAQRLLGRFEQQRATYRAFAERLMDELGTEPSARVRAMLVDEHAVTPTVSSADSFVGRERELQELAALLARAECRVLTVVGPGGVGKSQLLKQALRAIGPRFTGGAIWLPLDDLTQTEQVVARLVSELGLRPNPRQDPLETICADPTLTRRLLVLDNGEHLTGLPRLAERLVAEAPGLKICVSSRSRLGVRGEWLLPLHGLALPARDSAPSEILASDAVQLLVAAARGLHPEFDSTTQVEGLADLVRAVGGLPLAILLSAQWTRLLPLAQITAEVQRSLDLLESADDGEERPEHRSVRATFEQSWRLLNATEQHALRSLSVFVGTFTLGAAREVADAPMPVLAALVDKSLLQILDDGRCSLHPLIRRFARDKLDVASRDEMSQRYAAWYHALLAQCERSIADVGPRALDDIDRELENCRAAWQWAIEHRAVDALTASALPLLRYFEVRGRAAEGLSLLRDAQPLALEVAASHPALAANVGSAMAHLFYRLYAHDEVLRTARETLKFARAARSATAMFRCLNAMGLAHWQLGRQRDAKRVLEQAVRHARSARGERDAVLALGNLALVEKALGNYASARELMLDSLDRQRALHDWIGVATRLNDLAALHQAQSQWDSARTCLAQGLEVCEAHGIAFVRPHLQVNLALVCFYAGDLVEGERVAHQALADARANANRNVESTALLLLVRLAVRRRDFDEARMRLAEAIACSLAMGAVAAQLDCVFCYAEMLAAQGDADAARKWMRYYVARPDVEPGDREVAGEALRALPAARDEAPPPDDPLDAVLRQLLAETASPRATAAPAASV